MATAIAITIGTTNNNSSNNNDKYGETKYLKHNSGEKKTNKNDNKINDKRTATTK